MHTQYTRSCAELRHCPNNDDISETRQRAPLVAKNKAPSSDCDKGAHLPEVGSIKITAQFLPKVRMAQFAQRYCFDLTDALTGDAELHAHFFECAVATIL